MGHCHSFGTSGRARGVDDVGEVVGSHPAARRARGCGADGRPIRVQAHHTRAARGELGREPRLGEQHRDGGILEHEGESLFGVARVQRHVGAAGFEDPQQPDDHLDGALGAQSDEDLGADAQRAQVVGELVGPRVELAVADVLVSAGDRHRRRRLVCLGLHELVHAGLGVRPRRVVPAHEHLLALRGGEHRKDGDGAIWILDDRRQQRVEMCGHPVDRARLEELGVIFEAPAEACRTLR